jgi:hypothetical protein
MPVNIRDYPDARIPQVVLHISLGFSGSKIRYLLKYLRLWRIELGTKGFEG